MYLFVVPNIDFYQRLISLIKTASVSIKKILNFLNDILQKAYWILFFLFQVRKSNLKNSANHWFKTGDFNSGGLETKSNFCKTLVTKAIFPQGGSICLVHEVSVPATHERK